MQQEFKRRLLLVLLRRIVRGGISFGNRIGCSRSIHQAIECYRHAHRRWSVLESRVAWLIDNGGRIPVRREQSLDALSQLLIRRTFAIEDRGLIGRIRGRERRQE